MSLPDEADIDFDALYDEFINAARAAAEQALVEQKEEREIAEARETLLDYPTRTSNEKPPAFHTRGSPQKKPDQERS